MNIENIDPSIAFYAVLGLYLLFEIWRAVQKEKMRPDPALLAAKRLPGEPMPAGFEEHTRALLREYSKFGLVLTPSGKKARSPETEEVEAAFAKALWAEFDYSAKVTGTPLADRPQAAGFYFHMLNEGGERPYCPRVFVVDMEGGEYLGEVYPSFAAQLRDLAGGALPLQDIEEVTEGKRRFLIFRLHGESYRWPIAEVLRGVDIDLYRRLAALFSTHVKENGTPLRLASTLADCQATGVVLRDGLLDAFNDLSGGGLFWIDEEDAV